MSKRPNVVMILGDEHHLRTVGCYGGKPVRTPNIDRIAAEGMQFNSAFCCASICSPSRAALFTGLLPHRLDIIANDLTLPSATPNLAGLLSAQGYRLGYAGKWHVDRETLPTDHGFEGRNHPGYGFPVFLFKDAVDPVAMQKKRNPYYEYLMENGFDVPTLEHKHAALEYEHMGDTRIIDALQTGPKEASIPWYVGSESVASVRRMAQKKQTDDAPFFLWANFWGPHNPCFIPEPYYSMYDPSEIAEEPSWHDDLRGKPTVQRSMAHYWGMYGAEWRRWQNHIAKYMGYCTLIDDQVGRIRSALEAAGELDNTIFIYAADHGDMLGRHQLMDKGPMMYDDTYRIPLVVRGPGIKQGTSDEFVYLHDLFNTIIAAGGAALPAKNDGSSLVPLLNGTSGWQSREAVYGASDLQIISFPQRMVRTRTHKFIYNASAESEMYDLVQDPHEMGNIIDEPTATTTKGTLKAMLLAHMKQTQDPLWSKFELLAPTL